ncbi:hypothetical protein ACJIZ3_017055 [Penstemon smallii]|uniref:Cupin type-1 domain-containing protein n=1 Tax=Penstemon smallii TaxID=265156 RepID=A0ABD3SVK8_9LAMI
MAKYSLPLLLLFILNVFLHGCSSKIFLQNDQQQQQQQHKLRARTDCRVEQLTAQEPTIRYKSEAGQTEFWDRNNEQFECAGVAAVRNIIQSKGLLGLLGTVIPGCAETYESEIRQQEEEEEGSESEQSRRFVDRHQKVRQFRQGDVLALPAGFTLWLYNNGDDQLITVALLDTGNEANQLDQTFRNFFLAGKPQGGSQSHGKRSQGQKKHNIFYGLDDEILAEIFGVGRETVRKIKGQDDERGQIVRAERLNVVIPREREWESSRPNGLEETVCSLKLRENLDEPSTADVYNPQAGRLSSLNSHKLPILSLLRLSAQKGVLRRNAIMAPHWTANAHSIIYVTRGSGRFQVVGHTGKSVYDGEVQEGQMIIVPQNFVVVKKASDNDEGLEWISFKTNDNAIASPLAGRLSAFRAMPEEVLMNAYHISKEDARRLKYSREETGVFSSSSSSRSHMPKPMEYAFDVIKTMM